eukprot:3941724-Prymnesium_polylepis.1
MAEWTGRCLRVRLSDEYTPCLRLNQLQLRDLLHGYDDFDIFGQPIVFRPEGAEHQYDFKQMMQIRIDDPSRRRRFQIVTLDSARRV